MQKSQVQFLGQEDPLEKGVPTHSSTVAWESHVQIDTGRLQSVESQSDVAKRLTLSLSPGNID